jgi:hypothetical protein
MSLRHFGHFITVSLRLTENQRDQHSKHPVTEHSQFATNLKLGLSNVSSRHIAQLSVSIDTSVAIELSSPSLLRSDKTTGSGLTLRLITFCDKIFLYESTDSSTRIFSSSLRSSKGSDILKKKCKSFVSIMNESQKLRSNIQHTNTFVMHNTVIICNNIDKIRGIVTCWVQNVTEELNQEICKNLKNRKKTVSVEKAYRGILTVLETFKRTLK